MTTIHLVRGLYLAISLAVAVSAGWRARNPSRPPDVIAHFAFAAYAAATAASQGYAFDKPLTIGTAYVGIGVAGGLAWLFTLVFVWKRR